MSVFTEKISGFEPREQEKILAAYSLAGEEGAAAASIVIDLNLDAPAVIAALLMNHSPEEGKSGSESAGSVPDGETAALLDGIAKISRVSGKSRTLLDAEKIRNMLFVMTDDYRVILVMLAAKLSGLRAAGFPAVKNSPKALAEEAMNVYAPLAGRLGVSWIKDELEDLSLKILNREAYRKIKDMVAAKRGERNEILSAASAAIGEAAERAGIPVEVSSRAKHFYSVYTKMTRRNKSAAEIFDLFGIRILCDSIEQCYTLLGIVHRLWKPAAGAFKDYIAGPKPNGYRSLHTAVRISGGDSAAGERFLEIQIRTREMHHIAEYGVASHWLYKRGLASEMPLAGDGASLFDTIRRAALKKSVYVFTPQGKVTELPAGATPIDFAYSIHSAVGDHCVGAKADGSIIPLHAELKNTQTVEILTNPQAHPGVNWLETAKTSKAKNKIRSWLEKNGALGAAAAEKSAVPKKKASPGRSGRPDESAAAPLLRLTQSPGGEIARVRIADEKNMLVRFARCCRPVSGDPIAGYVSRGRGIIIHRENCFNLANIPDFAERVVRAEWDSSGADIIRRFRVEARFRANLFSEIEGAARKHHGHLTEGRLEDARGGALPGSRLEGFFSARFENDGDAKAALKKIRGLPGILNLRLLS